MRYEVKRPGRSESVERGLDWAWLMALEEYIAHFLLRWEVAPTSDGVQMEMDRGRSEQQFNLTTYGPPTVAWHFEAFTVLVLDSGASVG